MKNQKTYVYASEYCVVTFSVTGEDDWTQEQYDSASEFDLKMYVTNPDNYWLEDVLEDANA